MYWCILGEESYLHIEPLSPSKALRIAMLKKRFAGTIVKAQQNALLDHVIYLVAYFFFSCKMDTERYSFWEENLLYLLLNAVLFFQGKEIDLAKLQLEKERLEKRQQEGRNLPQFSEAVCAGLFAFAKFVHFKFALVFMMNSSH